MKIKKQKVQIKCVIKRKLKFENCLEVTQLENEINYLQKNELNINSFFYKRKHEGFIKNNKTILNTAKI